MGLQRIDTCGFLNADCVWCHGCGGATNSARRRWLQGRWTLNRVVCGERAVCGADVKTSCCGVLAASQHAARRLLSYTAAAM